MTNPFRKHVNNLFATHGSDVDGALTYSLSVINTLSNEDRIAAMTAVMVLVNTAAEAFDKIQAAGPSPEKIVLLDLIRSEIDRWSEDELEGKLASWASNELDIESSIDQWMDDNLEDRISNLDLVVRAR